MFRPPICPYRTCPEHVAPRPRFYIRSGYYHPDCRSHPVQRYRCKSCKRTFSRQTFRADFRDHRPHLNHRLVELVASGVGIRQSARILRLSPRCTELKLRKIGRHLRRLNANLHGPLPEGSRFHFDELETYEGQRNTRPLTVPVLIESMTRFIVWAESATIRPRGRMTEKRIGQIARSEALHGPRRDNSRTACLRVLRRGAAMCGELSLVRIDTDEKQTYPGLIAGAFGDRPVEHETTSSKVPRDAKNPRTRWSGGLLLDPSGSGLFSQRCRAARSWRSGCPRGPRGCRSRSRCCRCP